MHSRDFVILKTSSGQGGFVDAMAKEHRVAISPSGHDSPSNHFQMLKVVFSLLSFLSASPSFLLCAGLGVYSLSTQ